MIVRWFKLKTTGFQIVSTNHIAPLSIYRARGKGQMFSAKKPWWINYDYDVTTELTCMCVEGKERGGISTTCASTHTQLTTHNTHTHNKPTQTYDLGTSDTSYNHLTTLINIEFTSIATSVLHKSPFIRIPQDYYFYNNFHARVHEVDTPGHRNLVVTVRDSHR